MELAGMGALHRQATELRRESIVDIFIDLSAKRNARAESLNGFIQELELRLRAEGDPSLN